MIDPRTTRRWLHHALYAGLAAAVMFLGILPISTAPARVPGPDLVLCLTFAWVLRRPDYVPALLIALVVLAGDIVHMRPPGLWAAFALLGAEVLRGRLALSRQLPFPAEWAMVAVVATAMTLGYRLALSVAMVDQPGMALALMRLLATLAAYPLVAAASRFVFGVQRAAAGRSDARGRLP